MSLPTITIRYRRLPDREDVFHQVVLDETPDRIVTFLEAAPIERPVTAGGRVILEPQSPVVWFTYPGRWHDIGRFHLRDGTFAGTYANILTPVEMREGEWRTTDLLLDVWKDAAGEVETLDEEEFEQARTAGWLDDMVAQRARAEADDLTRAASIGKWPPADVAGWTLERARARIRELRGLSARPVRPSQPGTPTRAASDRREGGG